MPDLVFPGATPAPPVLGHARLPGNTDLTIWQGDAQQYNLLLHSNDGMPLDLTGCTAQAVVRQTFSSPEVYEFTCTIHDGNEVNMYMPSAVSTAMPAGDYVWNFQITSPAGEVRTYLAGDVRVYAEVDS
jgi:hypothetical protein